MPDVRLWPRGGLWRHRDFLKLWSAETISVFGSQFTGLALPLVAVLLLDASAFAVSALFVVEFLPFILFAIPAGVWVDRLRRKPILVTADLARAALLVTIPIAYAADALTLPHLYAVGFLVGICTVFFDVAYQSYLPSLVARDQLVDGNSKLEISRSTSQLAGPGAAGALISALGAPLAILLDSISFFLSAVFLFGIRRQETPPERAEGEARPSMFADAREGLGFVTRPPLSPAHLDLHGDGELLLEHGRGPARRLRRPRARNVARFARYRVLARERRSAPRGVHDQPDLGPARRRSHDPHDVVPVLGGHGAHPARDDRDRPASLRRVRHPRRLRSVAYNITQLSFRQAICPPRLQGRMNAVIRFLVWGTLPLGALLGGALGTWVGLRPALWVAAIGALFTFLPILLSPVPRIREMPEPIEDDEASRTDELATAH